MTATDMWGWTCPVSEVDNRRHSHAYPRVRVSSVPGLKMGGASLCDNPGIGRILEHTRCIALRN